jgi:hypothetical protein
MSSRCFYCNQAFWTRATWGSHSVVLKPVIDHVVPVRSGVSDLVEHNYVRCCQMCNGFKGARVFESIEEIRGHVAVAWARRGIDLDWPVGTVLAVPGGRPPPHRAREQTDWTEHVAKEVTLAQAWRLRFAVEMVVDDLKAAERASWQGESPEWRRDVLQTAIKRLSDALEIQGST